MELVKTNNNFSHEIFGNLTTITNENNDVFFIGKEVATILGYRDSEKLTRRLDEDEFFKLSYEESNHLFFCNEKTHSSGLLLLKEKAIYKIISNSRKLSVHKKESIINWLKSLGFLKEIILISRFEIEFFDLLEKVLKPFNLTLLNQYYCLNYKLDGYIKELNVVIEYDEKQHEYQLFSDRIRENKIKKELNCKFIRVSYKETNAYNVGFVIKNIFEL